MLERFLTRCFEREEMDGDGRCATYLVRWTLLKLPGKRGVYLHHFVGDDWCLDLHDHPKRFVSIGLWGGYMEHTPTPAYAAGFATATASRRYRAPWFRTFPADHTHRISLINGKPCWTLVVVIDIPDLLASHGEANTPSCRSYFARRALEQLHAELPGCVIVARMQGVGFASRRVS
ncbi:MAG: hypothetical protein ACRD15_05640 [Vicinamibacterales bacterium]